jgi:hypothetical protein
LQNSPSRLLIKKFKAASGVACKKMGAILHYLPAPKSERN